MGFRCPVCNSDFGNDKNSFDAHLLVCNHGLAHKFVNDVITTCESRPCEPPEGDKEDCEFYNEGECEGVVNEPN